MLGVFAEFETNLRRERQLEGIAKAKAAGVYKGRPASIEALRVLELKAQGMRPTDIAKALKLAGRRFIGCWRRVRERRSRCDETLRCARRRPLSLMGHMGQPIPTPVIS
jgi:DNA invertase Pin-like site-specific DNA recombinase